MAHAVNVYITTSSQIDAFVAQGSNLIKDGAMVETPTSVDHARVHSAWEIFKEVGKEVKSIGTEAAPVEEDPQTGPSFIAAVGPSIIIGRTLTGLEYSVLCW